MLLRELFKQFDPSNDPSRLPDVRVTGVTEDSRTVLPGCVFVARSGVQADGTTFVADAARRGAVVVVTGRPIPHAPLPVVVVPDPATAASTLAHLYCARPSERLKVVGVTGTNGKTTVTYLIRHILKKVQKKCGLIGTVEIDDGLRPAEAQMTTPGAVQVADLMARMRDYGCHACAIETSSHALDQGRVAGVRFAAAAFTNLTRDHLDYHGDMERYAAAKARLFASLPQDAIASVNVDDPHHVRMTRDCRARIVTCSQKSDAHYRATDIAVTANGSNFILIGPDGRTQVTMSLVGRHNIENALAAMSVCGELLGLTVHQLAAAMKDAAGAPGRLQRVDAGQPFTLLVDYAHTDDALRNVLSALKPLCRGKLRVLFGAGGDRDRTKRPLMARAAADFADAIVVTSDNPRTENPDAIIREIVSGVPADTTASVTVEPDRRRAIELILSEADKGDIVLLAGKGHENYHIVGTERLHFDDVEEATRFFEVARRSHA